MWRYFALATAIVLAVFAIVAALPHAPGPDRQSRYSPGGQTPGPAQRDDRSGTPLPVSGEAPWALSALPECFRQISVARGSAAFVRAKIPRGAFRVPIGARFVSGDCRIWVRAGGANVERGANHLHIPTPLGVYVAERQLLLESDDGERGIVRTYVRSDGDRLEIKI